MTRVHFIRDVSGRLSIPGAVKVSDKFGPAVAFLFSITSEEGVTRYFAAFYRSESRTPFAIGGRNTEAERDLRVRQVFDIARSAVNRRAMLTALKSKGARK